MQARVPGVVRELGSILFAGCKARCSFRVVVRDGEQFYEVKHDVHCRACIARIATFAKAARTPLFHTGVATEGGR